MSGNNDDFVPDKPGGDGDPEKDGGDEHQVGVFLVKILPHPHGHGKHDDGGDELVSPGEGGPEDGVVTGPGQADTEEGNHQGADPLVVEKIVGPGALLFQGQGKLTHDVPAQAVGGIKGGQGEGADPNGSKEGHEGGGEKRQGRRNHDPVAGGKPGQGTGGQDFTFSQGLDAESGDGDNHDGGEKAFGEHGAVAHKEAVLFISELLAAGSRSYQGVKSRESPAGDNQRYGGPEGRGLTADNHGVEAGENRD